jgi:hypothetical protein
MGGKHFLHKLCMPFLGSSCGAHHASHLVTRAVSTPSPIFSSSSSLEHASFGHFVYFLLLGSRHIVIVSLLSRRQS